MTPIDPPPGSAAVPDVLGATLGDPAPWPPDAEPPSGAYAASLGIDALWAAGPESANTAAPFAGARAFASVEALIASLADAPPFASVLVKGSRFMKMERVVGALEGVAAGDAHAA